MKNPLVWQQGEILPAQEAKVSVFDRGFLFGDGVYESGRAYDRCPVFLEEHWARFRKSASRLELKIPYTDKELTDGLFELARAFGEDSLAFRTVATRGVIDRVGIDNMQTGKGTLLHIVQPIPQALEKYHREGMKILTSKIRRNPAGAQDPDIKTSNYLNSLLALQEVQKRGGQDAVMCDGEGIVTEGTTFSVFAVKGERLVTPSLAVGILDSITRRHVLSRVSQEFDVEEGKYTISEFLDSDEVFLASSVREVVSISEWDGKKFPIHGKITSTAHALLQQDIKDYSSTHPKY